MNKRNVAVFFCLISTLSFALPVAAQTRSPWEMHYGEGLVSFGFCTSRHGDNSEYDFATIPAEADAGWAPAPNGDTIGFSQVPSTLCGVISCRCGAQFTYFQTFVSVPADIMVTTFTIAFSGIDDGVRTTIFNSDNPDGAVVPGSYVYLGGSGTANLADLVKSGEVNRVVVTQTDDCCYHSYLSSAQVVLNGEPIPPIENSPPIAVCEDRVVVADDQCLGYASIDGGSYDPDGEPWTIDEVPQEPFGLGVTDVSLTIVDPEGESDSCTATVTVVDDTPPLVEVADIAEIWPPDHKLVHLSLLDCVQSVSDSCSESVDVATMASIVSIFSDEPEDADGVGDGATTDDIVIIDNYRFGVRAERQGAGNGRVYGVAFEVLDDAGNVAEQMCYVAVPHDRSGETAVNDGPSAGYVVGAE